MQKKATRRNYSLVAFFCIFFSYSAFTTAPVLAEVTKAE